MNCYSSSPFVISSNDATKLVHNNNVAKEKDLSCYLLQLTLTPAYGVESVPASALRKLPRLVNGIPLGAGRVPGESDTIRWRYVDGAPSHTFLSVPLTKVDAGESRRALRDRLRKDAKTLFGEVAVKAQLLLAECSSLDEILLNDLASPTADGLIFLD